MGQSAATRFALIDLKLKEISDKLDTFQDFMELHAEEHKKISDKLSRQDVINGILIFVSGLVAAGIVGLVFKVFGG